jgi:hypothetical protein
MVLPCQELLCVDSRCMVEGVAFDERRRKR